MKNKIIKYFISIFVGFVFLFTLSSCGNDTKYLEGSTCGKATVEGTNSFSEIRRVYCEQFVYEFNFATYVNQGKDFENCADVYDEKFILNDEGKLEKIEITDDRYIQAHYLFVYMDDTNKDEALNYIRSANVENYDALVEICAYGKTAIIPTFTKESLLTNENYGYFKKINNLELDKDNPNGIASVQNRMTSHSKACFVFTDNFIDPATGVSLPKTTYKDAWDTGFFYFILVYPMAWFINVFVVWFGSTGWAQIGAILVVTFILKILILLITFKSQANTQKMQDIQPEIFKIQSKYGPMPSPEDKQRMAMELMGVYKKYGVRPFAPFISLIITFPIFIAMYRSVITLGILRTGKIGGVTLGNGLSSYIIGGNFKFTALIIFLIMAASQILSMKLPQIMNRKRMSDEAKKQQKQSGRQANMMTNIMMIIILVMGFTLPVTMSIYWIASAVVGIVQSVIMHKFNNANRNKKGKYKVKKAEEKPITIPQGYKK